MARCENSVGDRRTIRAAAATGRVVRFIHARLGGTAQAMVHDRYQQGTLKACETFVRQRCNLGVRPGRAKREPGISCRIDEDRIARVAACRHDN